MNQQNVLGSAKGLNSGTTYQLIKKLAAGGQGEVFIAQAGGQSVALKLYFSHMGDQNQREMVMRQVSNPLPVTPEGRRFVWPQDLVQVDAWGRWGYVMPLVDRGRFLDLGEIQAKRKTLVMTQKRICEVGYQLSSSMHQLHLSGLCYLDISRNNVLIDPFTGEICIIDNDNVGVVGEVQSSILGTAEYMAPEVITSRSEPSIQTDLHSLAVLLFEIWTWHHPMHGDLESRIHCWDMLAKKAIYGDQAVFIFDPDNASNRPNDPDYRSVIKAWSMVPPTLQALFTRAFTAGLREPGKRVTEGEWLQAFMQLYEGSQTCSCGAENLWDPKGSAVKCWHCSRTIPLQPRLRIETGAMPFYLLLTPGTQLLGHHLRPSGGRKDPPVLLGQIVQNPNNPAQWGLQNLTGESWTFDNGGAVHLVPPQKSSPLTTSAKLTIANKTCTIQA